MQLSTSVGVLALCARVVITDLAGKYLDQVGGNGPALRDGSNETAALNRPQGLAYSPTRDCLYVADTENNALREVSPQGAVGEQCSAALQMFLEQVKHGHRFRKH